VKLLDGRTHTFQVDSSHTVNDIKVNSIYEREGTHPAHQRLIFGGQELYGNYTLETYIWDPE
jgi:hypothetical protein